MQITCGTCNGDGFVSFGDRHVENRKEVCGECKGYGVIEARTGEVPQASASPDGKGLYADDGRRHTRVVPEPLEDPRAAVAQALARTTLFNDRLAYVLSFTDEDWAQLRQYAPELVARFKLAVESLLPAAGPTTSLQNSRVQEDVGQKAWGDLSPQEIVRRVRCMADDAAAGTAIEAWRDACDTILKRLGTASAATPVAEST